MLIKIVYLPLRVGNAAVQQAAASVIDKRAAGHLDAEAVWLAPLNACGDRDFALWLQACLSKCFDGGLMQSSVQCPQH